MIVIMREWYFSRRVWAIVFHQVGDKRGKIFDLGVSSFFMILWHGTKRDEFSTRRSLREQPTTSCNNIQTKNGDAMSIHAKSMQISGLRHINHMNNPAKTATTTTATRSNSNSNSQSHSSRSRSQSSSRNDDGIANDGNGHISHIQRRFCSFHHS